MPESRPVVAVTGAFGFVGQAVCRRLVEREFQVVALTRRAANAMSLPDVRVVEMGDMRTARWSSVLAGVNAVVHLAARVHVMEDTAADPLESYRAANVAPTRALARAAAEVGVRQVVYMSSIKVNGEGPTRISYCASDNPAPVDAYGVSKLEAERALAAELHGKGTGLTVVRPPLVYGPGVRANFLRLLRWIDRGVPLPLASVHNRRSLVFVDNLADLVARCLEDSRALGQTLLVSDPEDLSTPELVRAIAQSLGRRPRLFPFPVGLLRAVGTLARREQVVKRLCDSLTIDSSPTRNLLTWQAPWSTAQGLEATARWYTAVMR